jgi:HSP20 family molecular chaperone IbpA
MHISFRGSQLVLTWKISKIKESIVDGVREREREVHHFHRVVSLPIGTTVSLRFILDSRGIDCVFI